MFERRCRIFMLLSTLASALSAQSPVAVPPGAPIRAYLLRLPSEAETSVLPRVSGDFAGARRDTIFLIDRITGDPSWLPLRNLDHIEYSTGRYHPLAKGSLIGGALGLLIGGGAGVLRNAVPSCGNCTSVGNLDGGLSRTQYALVGTAIGIVGGFVSGVVMTVEHWHVAQPTSFTTAPRE
jgi:hypothetical protein